MELAELNYSGILSPQFYNEPLTDKRIVDLIIFARKHLPNSKIIIFTNFTLMTHEIFNKLFYHVDEFVVTIDEPVIKEAVSKFLKKLNEEEQKKIRTRSLMESGSSNRGGSINIKNKNLTKQSRCMIANNYLIIDAEGNVRLCYNDFKGETCFGNISNKTIKEIWYSKEFVSARADVFSGDYKFQICKNCLRADG